MNKDQYTHTLEFLLGESTGLLYISKEYLPSDLQKQATDLIKRVRKFIYNKGDKQNAHSL